MSKRSIASFFPVTPTKRTRVAEGEDAGPESAPRDAKVQYESHPSYPIPLPASFPFEVSTNDKYKEISDKSDLSLRYYQPLFPSAVAKALFEFLRAEFCWYRVTYEVRGMTINTPRFTTVFGLDETHYFSSPGASEPVVVLETATHKPPKKRLGCTPRPMPGCLRHLKSIVESTTGSTFNFCLLNYYKDNSDSISYHSDDEVFLGPDPTIASLSLGTPRDFHMRHKKDHAVTFRCTLRQGDMLLMRERTQSQWDHAVPKRKGSTGSGRINITFRRAMVRYGTENYYRYNVHDGPYYRWDDTDGVMVLGQAFDDERMRPSYVEPRSLTPLTHTHPPQPSRHTDSFIPDPPPPPTTGPKLESEDSFDIEAHVRAIDEAVALATINRNK